MIVVMYSYYYVLTHNADNVQVSFFRCLQVHSCSRFHELHNSENIRAWEWFWAMLLHSPYFLHFSTSTESIRTFLHIPIKLLKLLASWGLKGIKCNTSFLSTGLLPWCIIYVYYNNYIISLLMGTIIYYVSCIEMKAFCLIICQVL